MAVVQSPLAQFATRPTVLLTSFKRDGSPISTAVSLAVEGNRAYFRTWQTAWKFRRLMRNPEVLLLPSTALGRPTGPSVRARARLLEGSQAEHAAHLLARKHGLLHSVIVPLIHRVMRYRTVHFEVTAV